MQNLQVFAWLIGLSPIRGSLNAYPRPKHLEYIRE
jgi:hypothetical protein